MFFVNNIVLPVLRGLMIALPKQQVKVAIAHEFDQKKTFLDILSSVLSQQEEPLTKEFCVVVNSLLNKEDYSMAAAKHVQSMDGLRNQLCRKHHGKLQTYACGQKILPHGYNEVIKHLARGLAGVVKLNTVVKSVVQEDGICRVTSTAGATYFSDFVICTVSLGVLKAETISFTPSLSAPKKSAIARMGFGTNCRIHLVFAKIFWSDAQVFFSVAASTPFQFFPLHLYGQGAAMQVLTSPDYSEKMNTMSDEQVLQDIMTELRSLHSGCTEYISYRLNRWGENPSFLGTMSFLPVGVNDDVVCDLARPEGNVHFAGEATSGVEMQMCRGAFTSGILTSSSIVREWNDRHKSPAVVLKVPSRALSELPTSGLSLFASLVPP